MHMPICYSDILHFIGCKQISEQNGNENGWLLTAFNSCCSTSPPVFSSLSLVDFGDVKDDCVLEACSISAVALAHMNHPQHSLTG